MNRTQTIICTAVAAVALALLASPTMPAAYFYPGGSASTSPAPPRACFPAAKWSADQRRRPCARVVRVAEDGTVRLRVENAGGRVRYSATVGARDR